MVAAAPGIVTHVPATSRSQRYVSAPVPLMPDHVPPLAPSVAPRRAVPAIDGLDDGTGGCGAATGPSAGVLAAWVPLGFDAVTVSRTLAPRSPLVSV